MNACSVPIPPGRDRDERREALGHLDKQDVPDRLLDPEGVEEEPDRDEAEQPVARLPERNLAQVTRSVGSTAKALADALLEVGDVEADPEEPERRR